MAQPKGAEPEPSSALVDQLERLARLRLLGLVAVALGIAAGWWLYRSVTGV